MFEITAIFEFENSTNVLQEHLKCFKMTVKLDPKTIQIPQNHLEHPIINRFSSGYFGTFPNEFSNKKK